MITVKGVRIIRDDEVIAVLASNEHKAASLERRYDVPVYVGTAEEAIAHFEGDPPRAPEPDVGIDDGDSGPERDAETVTGVPESEEVPDGPEDGSEQLLEDEDREDSTGSSGFFDRP